MPVDWHRALVHQLPMRGVPGRHTQWKDVPGIGTVPASWEVVRLGNVAEVAFSSVDKKTVDGEIPVELCNYTDVFYNRRIRPGMEFMTATASPVERRRWALRKGDVLFTKDSETPDEIGIPAYVTADMPKVLCGYHLGLARPRAELADGAYLAELLRSPRTARQFARIANGVTRFGLTLGATSSLKILLPPLPEQRAIAAVLDAIDDTIELTEAVIAATKELRRALLHELLTRGVPGWHSEWRDVPGIGTVPACWDVVRLGDVATLQRGVDLPIQDRVQGSVPVYGSNGILGTHAQALHPGPGVITGRSGSIGVVYSSTGPYWPLNTTLYVRDFHGNSDRFIYYLLSQLKLERFAASTGVPSLNRNFVHPQPVARPPLAEQRLIVAVLDGVDEAIERARDEKAGLQSLKASASGALLTGSVRVRQFNG